MAFTTQRLSTRRHVYSAAQEVPGGREARGLSRWVCHNVRDRESEQRGPRAAPERTPVLSSASVRPSGSSWFIHQKVIRNGRIGIGMGGMKRKCDSVKPTGDTLLKKTGASVVQLPAVATKCSEMQLVSSSHQHAPLSAAAAVAAAAAAATAATVALP